MRLGAVAILGFLLLASAGCKSPAPAPPPRVDEDPFAHARAVLEAGRYAEAVSLYRQVIEQSPASVAGRYGLAVALSHADRGAAISEFQWILANAKPGSFEAIESRQWLARAGILNEGPTIYKRPEAERQPGEAVLVGRAIFAEKGESVQPMKRVQLFLVGQPDSATKEERYNLRTDADGNYKFPSVVPGPYMLTNRIAGPPIWRLRVDLKPAEEKQLDLTPANSVGAQDDFPQPR